MPKTNVSVSVDDQHIDEIVEVAGQLSSAGMKVEQIMNKIGVIVGSCDSDKMEAISQVEGVSAVEPERDYQISPPESDIQ